MRLKYTCEFCGYSEIRHFEGQIIGEPYLGYSRDSRVVNFACPNSGVTQWNVNQVFTVRKRVHLFLYQQAAKWAGKLRIKDYLFSKDRTVTDWVENHDTE